jgi:hypothetical protein
MAVSPDQVIYMDNNATTRIAPEVIDAMMPYLTDYYGNPSSMHTFGGQVGQAINQARQEIADLLGANPERNRVYQLRYRKRFHSHSLGVADLSREEPRGHHQGGTPGSQESL